MKKSYYRNKADRLLQAKGREVYDKCLVCGKPMSCLHHYYPKSTAGNLRYMWSNCIPLCQGCHFRHHNGDPSIQNTINRIKGQEWLDNLNECRKKIKKSDTIGYYKEIIRLLSL